MRAGAVLHGMETGCARGELHLGGKWHVASACKWGTFAVYCEGLSHPGLTDLLQLRSVINLILVAHREMTPTMYHFDGNGSRPLQPVDVTCAQASRGWARLRATDARCELPENGCGIARCRAMVESGCPPDRAFHGRSILRRCLTSHGFLRQKCGLAHRNLADPCGYAGGVTAAASSRLACLFPGPSLVAISSVILFFRVAVARL